MKTQEILASKTQYSLNFLLEANMEKKSQWNNRFFSQHIPNYICKNIGNQMEVDVMHQHKLCQTGKAFTLST